MIAAIVVLVFASALSWLLVALQLKVKAVAIILSFISTLLLLIQIFGYATHYDPITSIVTTVQTKPAEMSEAPRPAIEVFIPEERTQTSSSGKEDNPDNHLNHYITKPVILNIGDTVRRNEDNEIYLRWTPIAGQTAYKLKFEIDSPFQNVAPEVEFTCDTNWCRFDVSGYEKNTVMFVSIAVLDDTSTWVYTEPINFTLE